MSAGPVTRSRSRSAPQPDDDQGMPRMVAYRRHLVDAVYDPHPAEVLQRRNIRAEVVWWDIARKTALMNAPSGERAVISAPRHTAVVDGLTVSRSVAETGTAVAPPRVAHRGTLATLRATQCGLSTVPSPSGRLPPGDRLRLGCAYLPNSSRVLERTGSRLYNCKFSDSGAMLVAAPQDDAIRVYRTHEWERPRLIACDDVHWAVSSVDISPDESKMIYSSMSDTLFMLDMADPRAAASPIRLGSRRSGGFAVYGARFSPSGTDVVAGCSNNCLVVYDLVAQRVSDLVPAHEDDINTVAFADSAARSNVLVSGSDDGYIKIWDRRLFGFADGGPAPRGASAGNQSRAVVGVLPGHVAGITSVSAKGDGYYIVSNGKDQCAKVRGRVNAVKRHAEHLLLTSVQLWDLRKAYSQAQFQRARVDARPWHFDYRWQSCPGDQLPPWRHPHDVSVMTYRGHRVLQTLIRAHFSPMYLTGQQFIYTGSADGRIYVYDVLTGEIVQVLHGHSSTVRDVAWHPFEPLMASVSFDGTIRLWTYSEDAAAEQAAWQAGRKYNEAHVRGRGMTTRHMQREWHRVKALPQRSAEELELVRELVTRAGGFQGTPGMKPDGVFADGDDDDTDEVLSPERTVARPVRKAFRSEVDAPAGASSREPDDHTRFDTDDDLLWYDTRTLPGRGAASRRRMHDDDDEDYEPAAAPRRRVREEELAHEEGSTDEDGERAGVHSMLMSLLMSLSPERMQQVLHRFAGDGDEDEHDEDDEDDV